MLICAYEVEYEDNNAKFFRGLRKWRTSTAMCSPGSTQSEGWYRKGKGSLPDFLECPRGHTTKPGKLAKKFPAKNICWDCFYVRFCLVGNFLANAALSNFKVQTSPENCSQQVSKASVKVEEYTNVYSPRAFLECPRKPRPRTLRIQSRTWIVADGARTKKTPI